MSKVSESLVNQLTKNTVIKLKFQNLILFKQKQTSFFFNQHKLQLTGHIRYSNLGL